MIRRVLWDECVPWVRGWHPEGLLITTVQRMGWSGIKNGELIARASQEFDVFVTADKNLRYQQDLSIRKLIIVELPTNDLAKILRMLPVIADAIAEASDHAYVVLKLEI